MTCYFMRAKGSPFKKIQECCWKAEMVKHEKTMCTIMHHVIFPMWMAKLTHHWSWFLSTCNVCCVGKYQEPSLC
jgi:hypothetical protein